VDLLDVIDAHRRWKVSKKKVEDIRKLLCRLGFHDWEYTHVSGPRENRKCRRCGRQEQNMYDMAYGDTYWTLGKWEE
jgi:hypothetical protein